MVETQRPLRDALLRVLSRPRGGSRLPPDQDEARLDSAKPIAFSGNVYAALTEALRRQGVASEGRSAELLYTVLTSRLLARPMSALVKVSPAANRSLLDRLVTLLPKDDVEVRSGFSAKAIAYGSRSLKHKVLVVREAGGLKGREGEMLWRNLSPERGIEWEVARRRGSNCTTDEVRREGPMALVMMTSQESFRPDGEMSQVLPLTIEAAAEDTDTAIREISQRFAGASAADAAAELARWQAFQEVLAANRCEVVIPFAPALGRLFQLRTGHARHLFEQLLAAVATSALLHQFTRERDGGSAVIATLDDYAHARRMLEKPFADASRTEVPDGVQELIDVLLEHPRGLDLGELAAKLNVDRTTALRRARKAKALGLAVDLAGGQGRRSRLVAVQQMPADECALPDMRLVEADMQPDDAIGAVEPSQLPDPLDEPIEAQACEPEPIEPTEPEPLLPAPEVLRQPKISDAPEPEPVEPTGPEREIETRPSVVPAQRSHATAAPPLPPIVAKAPNPKSLTGGYQLREQQFKFRAAMEAITGRRWRGS